MSELYDEWARLTQEAEMRARAAGRSDLVDYLALRASNDLARQTSTKWLLESFTGIAAMANRKGGAISITRVDTHRFNLGNASMSGQLLTLKSGVRELTVEAGWPRTPADGIVRGGGLARGNIRHLGERAADQSLLLVKGKLQDAPQWVVLGKNGERNDGALLLLTGIQDHISRLSGGRL